VLELRDGPDIDLDALVLLRRTRTALAHARDAGAATNRHSLGRSRVCRGSGVTTAYISSVMVDPDHRLRGIGRAEHDGVKFVLHTLGFTAAVDMLVRDRR
jgi:GNAT superfamily N-acetyltransferase